MTTAKCITAIVALTGFMATSALAQTQPRDPNMQNPRFTIPEKVDPGTTGSTGQTLSDKLERSEGVLMPPAIGDSEAVVPPPHMPSMPVIKPPGTSPSDPLQPK